MRAQILTAARYVKNATIGAVCRFLGAFFHTRVPVDLQAIRTVAIVKPCCLGDVLMATPALRAIREALPGARIDYFVGSWSRSALEGNPNVDNLVDCGALGAGRYGLR